MRKVERRRRAAKAGRRSMEKRRQNGTLSGFCRRAALARWMKAKAQIQAQDLERSA